MNEELRHPLLGVAMRTGGLATLAISWFCGRELWRLHGVHELQALCFLLALITFLAGCAGSAMLVVGPHLLDKVEVSERWARQARASHLPSIMAYRDSSVRPVGVSEHPSGDASSHREAV